MRGNAVNRNERLLHLPCAGITLIRFYGFYLSTGNFDGHPGETLKFCSKTKDKNFFNGL